MFLRCQTTSRKIQEFGCLTVYEAGCSKRLSNEAADETKPQAYPLGHGRTVPRIGGTMFVRAAEMVRRPGLFFAENAVGGHFQHPAQAYA